MPLSWHVGRHDGPGQFISLDHRETAAGDDDHDIGFVHDLISVAELESLYGQHAKVERVIGQYRAMTSVDGAGAHPRFAAGAAQIPYYWRLRIQVFNEQDPGAQIVTVPIYQQQPELLIDTTPLGEDQFMWQRDHPYTCNTEVTGIAGIRDSWGMPRAGTPLGLTSTQWWTMDDQYYGSIDLKVTRRLQENQRLVMIGIIPEDIAQENQGTHLFQFVLRVLVAH